MAQNVLIFHSISLRVLIAALMDCGLETGVVSFTRSQVLQWSAGGREQENWNEARKAPPVISLPCATVTSKRHGKCAGLSTSKHDQLWSPQVALAPGMARSLKPGHSAIRARVRQTF